MKTQFKFLLSAAVFLAGTMGALGFQSDPAEVPGDNFSLEGALELFKKSKSPQEFEQLLNSPDSKVNNLDLNGDGEIDYVRVTDRNNGNVHAFILSAVVSANESQDVAVIELEKRNDGSAVLQIVGDADVYGIETIIEPTEEVKVNAGASTARTVVNVWAWPSVQYVYSPYYSVWASPWSWGYYPGWYRPWRPLAWAYYDPFWAPYRPYYSVCYRHRIAYAPAIYRPYRTTSVIVYNRNYAQISNFRNSSHGYRYDRGDHARNNRYDAEHRSRADYSSHNNNGRSYNNNSRSSGDRWNGGRSNDTGGRSSGTRTRTFDNNPNDRSATVERNRSNDRSTSFHRSTPDNSSRPQRQFEAPAQRQHSGGGSGVSRMPQQSHRSMSAAPSGGGGRQHGGGGGAPAGGGGHSRGRH
jgi:hypothetical protein